MSSLFEFFNRWGEVAARFAWPMVWQSSLLIAVLFTLDFALRRKVRAAVRYALWLVVLVKLVMPPSLALPTGLAWWLRPSSAPAPRVETRQFVVSYSDESLPVDSYVPDVAVAASPPVPRLSFTAIGLVASGGFSLVLFGFLVWRWRQVAGQIRKSEEPSDELREFFMATVREAGVRGRVRLRMTGASMSPAVCGLVRPCIVLPRALVSEMQNGAGLASDNAGARLRAVLLHELMHVRRADVWVNCAQTLLQIVYWWHPLLWFANSRIRRLREEAVDDAVMMALRDDAEVYAPTLLEVAKLAFHRPLASLGLVGILESKRALSRRIERLLDFQPPRRAGLSFVSVLGVAAFTCMAVPQGEAPPKPAKLLPAAASSAEVIENRETLENISAKYGDRTSLRKALEEQGMTYEKFRERIRAEFTNHVLAVLTADASVRPRTLAEANAENRQGRLNAEPGSLVTQEAKDQSAGLTREAAELFGARKLDEAAAKLKDAIKLNPANQKAYQYFDLIQDALLVEVQKKRDENSRRLLAGVEADSAWPAAETLRKTNSTAELFTRSFRLDPTTFIERLERAIGATPGSLKSSKEILNEVSTSRYAAGPIPGTKVLVRTNDDVSVSGAVRKLFRSQGVVLDPPKNVFWSDGKAALLVRATKQDLDVIETELAVLNTDSETPNANQKSAALTREAGELIEANRFEEAPAELKEAIKLNPTNRQAFQNANLIYEHGGSHARKTLSINTNSEPQINIRAKLVAIPKKTSAAFWKGLAATNGPSGADGIILSSTQAIEVLKFLKSQKGVEMMSEPQVTTLCGRQAQIQVGQVQPVLFGVTNGDKEPHYITTNFFSGLEVDLIACAGPDSGAIQLTATNTLKEFLGYDDPGKERVEVLVGGKLTRVKPPLPRFREHNLAINATVLDGQTLVLGRPQITETVNNKAAKPVVRKEAEMKDLVVFITPTLIDAAGNPVRR